MKLKDIKPNPNNPRLIKDAKFAKLVKSIKDFPKMMELRPIIIDDNNIVLGGNMRLKALKELKYKDIPDTWTKSAKDLTEEETRRFIIADNIGFGEHDWDILANEWDAKELEEWGLEGFPFEDEVLEAEEDDYTEPENMKVDVVLGDLIEIGEHRLLCGSSTEMDTWQKVMGDELCDLVITDPPYNVAYVGKTKEALTIDNDKQSDGDFYQFLFDFYTALGSYTKKGGSWYVFHADSEGANFRQAMKDAGIMVKQCLIWVQVVALW